MKPPARDDRHADRRAVGARPEALRGRAGHVAQAAVQPAGDDLVGADERDEDDVTALNSPARSLRMCVPTTTATASSSSDASS
jgi:hypothetical protein